MGSVKFPLWIRIALLLAIFVLAAGAGLLGYRYYTHPRTLTVAAGSIDGEGVPGDVGHCKPSGLDQCACPGSRSSTPGRRSGLLRLLHKATPTWPWCGATLVICPKSGSVVVVGACGRAYHRAPGLIHHQHRGAEKPDGRGDRGGDKFQTAGRSEQGIWPLPNQGIQGPFVERRPACASVETSERHSGRGPLERKVPLAGARSVSAKLQGISRC